MVASIYGNSVDPGVVGAARGMGTDEPAWSESGSSCTDGVGTSADYLPTRGAASPSAANLSWNKRVNIRSYPTPSPPVIWLAAVF